MQYALNSRSFRLWLALASAVLVSLFASVGYSAGSVKWGETRIKERADGSWKVKLTITLPRRPDVGIVPMRFSFQPTAYYERAKVDGDRIVERTVPLRYQSPKVESMPVGFQNPRNGKTLRRTRFSFHLTRDSGFEAGEYKVTLTNATTGQKVGSPVTIRLRGENDVIDRRTISFEAEKPKSKPAKKLTDVQEGVFRTEGGETIDEPSDVDEAAEEPAGSRQTDPSAAPALGPQPVMEKPGACGCRVAGSSRSFGALGGLGAIGLVALALLRSRRRSSF